MYYYSTWKEAVGQRFEENVFCLIWQCLHQCTHQNILFFSFFCCPRIGERPAVLYFHYCMWARQGLVHCSATHSPTSSVLLSWCSLGGGKEGGGWIYAGVWVAGAPSAGSSPPVLDFMCTDRRGWRESCSAHWSSATSGVGVCASACLSLSQCVESASLLLVCALHLEWRRGERLSSVDGALMGDSADSGWDWGCWTGGGRACLSWDSSSSSRGSTRLPSTASSAACWDWPMCRASPLCLTAYTRWDRYTITMNTHLQTYWFFFFATYQCLINTYMYDWNDCVLSLNKLTLTHASSMTHSSTRDTFNLGSFKSNVKSNSTVHHVSQQHCRTVWAS